MLCWGSMINQLKDHDKDTLKNKSKHSSVHYLTVPRASILLLYHR